MFSGVYYIIKFKLEHKIKNGFNYFSALITRAYTDLTGGNGMAHGELLWGRCIGCTRMFSEDVQPSAVAQLHWMNVKNILIDTYYGKNC